jgi:ferric-dicitrate binding protein FerR (iron transport regulator)
MNRKFGRWLSVTTAMASGAALLFCAAPVTSAAPRATRQMQAAPQSMGSLSSAGTVYVNGVPAAADVTIFVGDTVKTGDTSSAAFSISGKGMFKLTSNSEMSFQPDPRYSGELKAGTVVMNSFGGATDISVRAGNFVAAPVIQAQQSASKIERHADGSFTITCLDGSVGLIPLEGATGRVLQAGESVNVLSSGELEQVPGKPSGVPEQTAATTPPASPAEPPVVENKKKKNQYLLIVLAGGAAVGIAAGLAGAGHGSPSISPSTP